MNVVRAVVLQLSQTSCNRYMSQVLLFTPIHYLLVVADMLIKLW